MYTADYSVRKYLMNKLINYVNLQYPSKATADKVKLYIGDSTVSRNQYGSEWAGYSAHCP